MGGNVEFHHLLLSNLTTVVCELARVHTLCTVKLYPSMGARRQGQGGGGSCPLENRKGENMHKIIVLNRFFAYS